MRRGSREVRRGDSGGAGVDKIVVPSQAWEGWSGRATRMVPTSELRSRNLTLALQTVDKVLFLGGSREDIA